MPKGARCVQRFDDSLNSAIHITYRISLRSSSMREPRDPLLKVIFVRVNARYILILHRGMLKVACELPISLRLAHLVHSGVDREGTRIRASTSRRRAAQHLTRIPDFANDPSAGSPTETLLRLLLPLNDQV